MKRLPLLQRRLPRGYSHDVNDLPPDAELVKAFRDRPQTLLVVVTLDLAAEVVAMAERAEGIMS